MKIALVRREWSSVGGAELYLKRMLTTLCKEGHQVILVTADEPDELPGADVRRVGLSGDRADRVFWFSKLAQRELALERVDCVFSLERIASQDVFRAGDGVHKQWLAQRRRYTPWWRRPFVGWGKFHRMVQWVEAQTLNQLNTRQVIVNSEMVKREIIKCYQYPPERIHLIRNGVEMDKWKAGEREATRELWGVEPDEFLLFFAGSGWERKGLRFLLKALIELRNPRVKLVVAGKGNWPWKVPGNVIYAGMMENLEDAYAASDLFVFPTIYDPSANVCFEALAAGLPVVTSAFNGAAEVIEAGVNGTVVADPSDVEGLVAAIKFWKERPDARPVPVKADLSLERNVRETLEVLMLASKEKGG
jgi:UDP-glucose:(heptosyl)LPS alpha-1,3-glucosyltransferase